ncbi:SIS domain-containing protein [Leptospira biflexa]|uniref:D-sedoheptulose-7-phosphate isomerase n=1 Tax=Leptospira biflexa TaxID=172 RepID=UPI0010831552|nr:SIS domain-containing protein [Leptospira biflexa]TGM31720.1 SIS domain-containing protein [Leptospira biflexa]TGM39121.1 SIS domain-containing protein [Leptospira biflexa]TGM44533.1 SIS domain-containing protein [Leptospira biflexa]TGM45426.1 SIS domain-containing protein [Leptospira biflexa]TGM53980.1 SIS domain-containing protein [Leptospira biflexa]
MSVDKIKAVVQSSIDVKKAIYDSDHILKQIAGLADLCLQALKAGGKVIFAGNGGSFADSQHLAAEFISRLQFDRDPLASVALGTNSSSTTAIGNDYGYDQVFVRELKAIGQPNDVFIPITTSGNSANILATIDTAKAKNMKVVGLTGESGGKLKELVDCICVPSKRTERIQESHILIGHIVCGLVEDGYFLK